MSKKKTDFPFSMAYWEFSDYFPAHVAGLYSVISKDFFSSKAKPNKYCAMGIARIAKACRMAEEVISRDIKALEYLGLVTWHGYCIEHGNILLRTMPMTYQIRRRIANELKKDGDKDAWVEFAERVSKGIKRDKKLQQKIYLKGHPQKGKRLVFVDALDY